MYGPVCVSVPINGLRYNAYLGFATTTTYPDLTAGLAAPGAAGPNPADPPNVLLPAVATWIGAMKADLDRKAGANDAVVTTVNEAVADITNMVTVSDILYQQPNGPADLFAALTKPEFREKLNAARTANYKTMANAAMLLTNMQNILLVVQLQNPGLADPLKTQLTNEMSAVSTLLATAEAYAPNGATTVAYRKQRQIFLFWDDRITHLNGASVFVQRNVACHTIGNETKSIAVSLNRTDLAPLLTGSTPTAVTSPGVLITVTCPSPFSVSAGLAMSFVPTKSYGLIPGSTAGAYTFGITKTTNLSAMPIAMVHARLYSFGTTSVQAGFGVAAHTQDDSAGGTGAEYLLGVGVSLFRTIYITPGWQMGRTTQLSTGYALGGAVPSGMTAPPLVNGYSSGFGMAITFTKP